MKPQNFEEQLIWYSILGTYVLYLSGLLYLFNSTIAWVLLFYLCIKLWNQNHQASAENKITIPWIIWLWIVCMLVMWVGTYMGLVDFAYDSKAITRGMLNWTREWALFALFPLAGCCLKIRPQLIYRAVCILCLQSLFFIPISLAAYVLKIPNLIYSSPLERITQNGPIYYDVVLYFQQLDATQGFRLTLFAPWSPALALVAITYFFFALNEKNKVWRWIGITSSILMACLTAARTVVIALPSVIILVWFLTNFYRPYVQILSSLTCFVSGMFSTYIIGLVRDFQERFTSSRQGSSRIRSVLVRIGFERFEDAPIWGHGHQELGFKGTANMPIGSHHHWVGLLFVKGLVGFVAFMLPIVSSFIYLLIRAQNSDIGKAGLSFILTLFVFSFGENLESLSYLYYPGLILMGIAFKARKNYFMSGDEMLNPMYANNL
jgi:O-Antigen ligase